LLAETLHGTSTGEARLQGTAIRVMAPEGEVTGNDEEWKLGREWTLSTRTVSAERQ